MVAPQTVRMGEKQRTSRQNGKGIWGRVVGGGLRGGEEESRSGRNRGRTLQNTAKKKKRRTKTLRGGGGRLVQKNTKVGNRRVVGT